MQITNKPLTSAILATTCLCVVNTLQPATASPAAKQSQPDPNAAKAPTPSKAPARVRTGGGCQNLSPATLAAKAAPYHETIHTAAQKYDVNPSLVKAVITIESCFKPNARGSSGEKGLMQLMPGTARRFNIHNGYNAWQNIHGGSRYLGTLMDRYQGNTHRAIAAYNAGEGNVSLGGRIPNTGYVNKVLTALNKFTGNMLPAPVPPTLADAPQTVITEVRKVALKGSDFRGKNRLRIASATLEHPLPADVPRANTQTLNPVIGMSMNTGANFGKAKRYTVQTGDTVYAIMRKTGIPVPQLVSLNDLPAPYGVKAGQVLRLR